MDGDVVAIQGVAYLITRGSSYSHDWRLAIDMPVTASGNLSCTLYPDFGNPSVAEGCVNVPGSHMGGKLDIPVFNDTLLIFPDPAGSLFVNSQKLYSAPWNLKFFPGPRAEFRLDLDQPVAAGALQSAPYDPYIYVRNTGQTVKLMEVDPAYQDSNGYPQIAPLHTSVESQSGPMHSSVGSLRRGHESSIHLIDEDLTEYHVVNAHEGRLAIPHSPSDMPSDWDLQQLERAELGHRSTPLTSRLSSLSTRLSSIRLGLAAEAHEPPPQQQTVIAYDNEVPAAYVTPVGLLVVGACVLGLVLFAV